MPNADHSANVPTGTFIEIAQALDSPSDQDSRLRRCLGLVRDLLHADRCSLLVDIEASHERELVSVPEPSPCEGVALKTRLDQYLNVVAELQPLPVATSPWHLGLPLVGRDAVAGFLLAERQGCSFSAHELQLFSVVAAQIGGYLTMLSLHRRAQELDRFKQEMSVVVVHDLKGPMAAMVGTVDMLTDDLKNSPDSILSSLVNLRSACARVQRLATNLLDLSRLESNHLPFRPRAVGLLSILLPLIGQRAARASARRIEIGVFDVPDDLGVEVDEDLFTRAMENVLDNALRYAQSDGRIEIRARLFDGRVQIRIGNTGPAIPESVRGSIFDKYCQGDGSHRMNLGLGLYFTRLAIESHGGRVWVEEGTTLPTIFGFEVPSSCPDWDAALGPYAIDPGLTVVPRARLSSYILESAT